MASLEPTVVSDVPINSQSDILQNRRREAERQKALGYWKLLRDSIQNTIHAVSEADARNILLTHGIHHGRKLNHSKELRAVLFNKEKEYVTCDGSNFRVFKTDGRKKSVVGLEEPMNRVLYISQLNMYVGYGQDEYVLYLMNSDFEVQSSAKSLAPITLAQYNGSTHEIITIGPSLFTAWGFRYNSRYLIPRKISNLHGFEDVDFENMILEQTASRSQRCFLSLDTGVLEYNVFEGILMSHHRDLHARKITAITFFNPLKCVVTGAKDGCIKVWASDWQVMLVFVGHTDAINCLRVYPYGPAIVSASLDCTVRVWSLESCDEIDMIKISKPIKNLGCELNHDTFFTYSDKTVELWRIQHLYQLHTAIGYRVQKIKHTSHPLYSVRSVMLCKDSSVRLISPSTGDVITTLLLPHNKGLVDAAYAISEGVMFVVTGSDSIIKCKTDTNPCTVLAEWQYDQSQEVCNYLLVYEYVVDGMMKDDVWNAMRRTVETRSLHEFTSGPGVQKNRNKTLLLGGRKDGYICVLNWTTGKANFKVEAHGYRGVLSMMANSKEDQLISAGMDNIIKVWRLYPFAEEALAPLMSFYCGHTPQHMVMMKNSLCVAFHDHSTATYSVVLYSLSTKNRSDHQPDDDHLDTITGLTACPKLHLFATSSVDGTVRVWNEANRLVKVLKLNIAAYSIGFCSQKGDLLLGIGSHVHKIPYQAYMPRKYQFKMACMKFLIVQSEYPIPYDENLLNQMSKNNVKRLKNAKASFKFEEYEDTLTTEEEEQVTREAKLKEKGYSLLEERENELKLLRDGALQPKKKPKKTKRTQREAFEKYMKIYYDKPKIQVPLDNPYLEDKLKDLLNSRKETEEVELYKADQESTGFFPSKTTQKTQSIDGSVYPVMPGGFVPNSVLARLLFPEVSKPKKARGEYKPPSFTQDQLDQIGSLDQDEALEELPEEDSEDVFSLSPPHTPREKKVQISDEVDEQLSDDEEEIKEVKLPPSNLLNKFEEIMKRPPTPKSEDEDLPIPRADAEEKVKPPSSRRKSISPVPVKKPVVPKREPRPPKPVVKIISQAAIKPVTPPRTASPAPSSIMHEPSPPPPPTPLPEFIMQFKGEEWFEKYFPNCNANSFPKPWTVEAFAAMLGRLIKIASYEHKVAVSQALTLLNRVEGLDNTDSLCKSFLSALNHQASPPSSMVQEEKTFIITGLRTIHSLGGKDCEAVAEILAQYIDGDQEVRSTAMDLLSAMGLQDPHRYLAQELDSWDTWNLEDRSRKGQVNTMCQRWLDRWMTSFKIHLQDTIEKLKKGQNVHGKLSRKPSKHSSTKHSQGGSSMTLEDDPQALTSLPEGVDFVSSDPDRRRSTMSTPQRTVTVNLENMSDPSILENATFIEAMNYFCEMAFEKELDKLRKGPTLPRSEEKVVQAKNTVLVLPKIAQKPVLVRLGETHTSVCRPRRENTFEINYGSNSFGGRGTCKGSAAGLMSGFGPSINLPMKTCYLNPFPSPLDAFDLRFQEPVLITLKSSQKYFIPSQSFCPALERTDAVPVVPAAR